MKIINEELNMHIVLTNQDNSDYLVLSINNRIYAYKSTEFNNDELCRKFKGIYKHSHGKALGWLKKNAYVVKSYEYSTYNDEPYETDGDTYKVLVTNKKFDSYDDMIKYIDD